MVEAVYIASVVGAVALFMMMPRRGFNPRKIGALLGACTLGGLWLVLYRSWAVLDEPTGLASGALGYYYLFSAIAIGSAVRVITHTKPVYAALWFVMVVLASAGLFLALNAEFIAFALVIIYGGAILVTYLFVLMLAAEAGDPGDQPEETAEYPPEFAPEFAPEYAPEYERIAREPAIAVAAGFLLLAVILSLVFADQPHERNPLAAGPTDRMLTRGGGESFAPPVLPNRSADRLSERLVRQGTDVPEVLTAQQTRLSNIERVGLDLFRANPLGLELAGVILLVSLIGAVVIARQKVST